LIAVSSIEHEPRRYAVSSTASATTPVGTWQLDKVHSSVGFEVAYLGGTFRGHFRDVAAELVVDESRATLTGSAAVASVDVKDENLSVHLQSPDFFDAERYPELRFVAEELGIDGESVTARGELTIKGVTKPVVVSGAIVPPLTDSFGNERVGAKLTTTVDRTDFGVSWNTPLPSGEQALADQVRIVTDLQFVKA
jgi:polyisoprenoid-binding protein YceI